MWIGLAIILLILWGVLKVGFGVLGFLVHILIVLAVISLILHFVGAMRSRG